MDTGLKFDFTFQGEIAGEHGVRLVSCQVNNNWYFNVKAVTKDQTKRTENDLPVHSFRDLLDHFHLAAITINYIRYKDSRMPTLRKVTVPYPLQREAFRLLAIQEPV